MSFDNILSGVASTFYQLPCTIDKLFCDGVDMFGLLYWHERLIEIDKAMKKDIPEPKKR